ncbi:pyruvate ferredoxin oxidoreductase [Patescibacteria group bacterium]|nr:pyruvate ferredoxin oxidoreductase [Patescibacteria group bacterium]MBU4512281.1 pyruvate ferredoxin oxidoreductase [Patescibacteria group bacterium]MCG2693281.1 thiamine pyrophosphate-dependent enzyme [Candidatus Parcubacteria bacterium]
MNTKELAIKIKKQQRFVSGHRSCAGCPFPGIVRTVLAATDDEVVVSCATSCLEVVSTIYPFTSWNIPWIHNTFENAAATISGVEAAYKGLKRKNKINKKVKFIAFGGDGGTYDIGLQSLSGALERGHDFVYVCYDNEGYQNTGGQRSSATPYGAATSTSPDGKVHHGKEQFRKDLIKICVAHNIPYAAQAASHNKIDLYNKTKKALETPGPAVLNVFSPCIPNWKLQMNEALEISKLAAETCFWPLYEVVDGKYKLNFKPTKKRPITDFLQNQGRFKHLFDPANRNIVNALQAEVDRRWEEILRLSEAR